MHAKKLGNRGEAGDIFTENIAYFIFLIVFFAAMLYWVVGLQDGGAKWEDFYAKEIARIIDLAKTGQEVYLDVTIPLEIAIDNGKSRSEAFTFDNVNNLVIVSLRNNGATTFGYFNDVDIVDARVELASGSTETNRLYFKVVEAQK